MCATTTYEKKEKRKHTINRYIANDVPDVVDDVRNGDREGELRRRVVREAQRKWGQEGKLVKSRSPTSISKQYGDRAWENKEL